MMESANRKPLRLWPGVVIAIILLIAKFGLPFIMPELMIPAILGAVVCGLAVFLWWLLVSRAPWIERLGAILLSFLALFAASRFTHVSIATGAEGVWFYILAIPVLGLTFVVWAVSTRRLSNGYRRITMILAILLACGAWTLVRTGGLTANLKNDLHWRWEKTSEEKLIAEPINPLPAQPPEARPAVQESAKSPEKPEAKQPEIKPGNKPVAAPQTAAVEIPAQIETGAEWPGFRGPHRDSVIRGIRIKTDWKAFPPAAMWRRAIGPGWSSFAVRSDLLFTQEQRGPEELVTCYRVSTGDPVWTHRDAARFWESNGGPGPRGTPTLNNGRVYALGATGILNVLNAADGSVVWSRNAAADTGMKMPQWGFAGSPLIVDNTVVVAVAGRLAAYDLAGGTPKWYGPNRGDGYSSPHLITIGGVAQIVLQSEAGATGVSPADGKMLWQNPWSFGIVQPAVTPDGDILISSVTLSGGAGLRRIAVAQRDNVWTTEERWTSKGLKPYFNDFVIHNGHAFGFDGSILACIYLKDGQRKWKGGRYGNGQMVLLADQDLLLVLSEEGELALVRAAPDQFSEVAHSPAIEGKTWNHPVLAGNVLLVRNGEQMAAFRLTLENR
jgi:outer membrane protein assembly factor BamB